ncbi:peptidylprolyl isomerase [Gracilibacillus thailandensis]|uniref:peptidylprolyl isomerase n=1 Tax=Gracilibacillus thailandensis TaxID=563735 RepID=A0A6N7R693_9BACI|nr:peptidyl-prolyl cis-trans isomerase [Gracilibacillus thailandensis]MRI68757.1 protein secretion protein [Gracilibacillus thailandensis]
MRVSRLVLWSIILLLLITNITTIFILSGKNNSDEFVVLDENPVDRNQPLAEIGDEEVLYQDWMNELIEQYGESVLHDLIDKEVVFQLAEDKDLEVHPKIIDRELSRMMVMQGVLSEEEKEKKIEKWTEQIKYRYYLQQLLSEDVSVSEAEIEEYYQFYQNQYQFDDMVQLSHILVSTQQEAEYVMARLDDGEPFNEVAKDLSIDEESRTDGGYLGFYSETSSFIPREYYDTAISLEAGTYSEPILVNNGYAIIFHHQHLPAIELNYDEVYEEVRQDVALDQLQAEVDASALWDQIEVELNYKNEKN